MTRLHPPLHRTMYALLHWELIHLGLAAGLHHYTLVEAFLRLVEQFLRLLEMFLRLSNTANSAKCIESGRQKGLPVGCQSTPGI